MYECDHNNMSCTWFCRVQSHAHCLPCHFTDHVHAQLHTITTNNYILPTFLWLNKHCQLNLYVNVYYIQIVQLVPFWLDHFPLRFFHTTNFWINKYYFMTMQWLNNPYKLMQNDWLSTQSVKVFDKIIMIRCYSIWKAIFCTAFNTNNSTILAWPVKKALLLLSYSKYKPYICVRAVWATWYQFLCKYTQ